jgi:hypothetical protein
MLPIGRARRKSEDRSVGQGSNLESEGAVEVISDGLGDIYIHLSLSGFQSIYGMYTRTRQPRRSPLI